MNHEEGSHKSTPPRNKKMRYTCAASDLKDKKMVDTKVFTDAAALGCVCPLTRQHTQGVMRQQDQSQVTAVKCASVGPSTRYLALLSQLAFNFLSPPIPNAHSISFQYFYFVHLSTFYQCVLC
jgi:hypothetical protein